MTTMASRTRKEEKQAPAEKPLELLYGEFPPYTVTFRLRGVKPFLFNALLEYEEEDTARAKKPRKPVDFEEMVWRTEDGDLALPTANVIAAICHAGRYFKSPIASRGSAKRTLQEALMPTEDDYSTFGTADWDEIDFRIARYQGMTMAPKPTWRPRLEKGWSLEGSFAVIVPELYSPAKILELLNHAGRVCGVGDGRKLGCGRFAPDGFEVSEGLSW